MFYKKKSSMCRYTEGTLFFLLLHICLFRSKALGCQMSGFFHFQVFEAIFVEKAATDKHNGDHAWFGARERNRPHHRDAEQMCKCFFFLLLKSCSKSAMLSVSVKKLSLPRLVLYRLQLHLT